VRNPIDAFVLARLEQAGLEPAPPADRLALLRRVTFDLTGLAPTPAECTAFLRDRAPDAYEKVVDRLLASPHYGERMAQHWLDLVRYAETEGYKLDRLRPDAYRYRDWVIRAFNDDLPYDRFAALQLAGDELESDNPDALVATGFFRLPAEEANGADYRRIRQDILNDITDVVGMTFLGLTVGCARCHRHKFDPIPQQDYYRLQAFFTPLLPRDDLPLAPVEARARYGRQLAAWEAASRSVRAEIDRLLQGPRGKIIEETVVSFDPQTQEAMHTPAERRTALQEQLAALACKQIDRRMPRLAPRRLPPDKRKRYDALQKKLAALDALKPEPLPTAMAAVDVGPQPPATYRLAQGNVLKPREEVQPGFPTCLDPGPPVIRRPTGRPESTGRRLALARWLCRPENPLTGRVIVNRLWQQALGRALVGTPNDFGAMGEPPSHPELVDWLACELTREGWRLKPLQRLIVTSATYRQASQPERNPSAARAARVDPQDLLLWHARLRRRDAESIRDTLLLVSGRLNSRKYGPSARPELPPGVKDNRYAWYADDRPEDQDRRSVYVLAKRNLAYPLFAAFDQPDRVNSCPARAVTITAPQALVLLNGELALAQARALAARLLAQDGADAGRLVRDAYLLAFNRSPDADEAGAAASFLHRQAALPGGVRPGITAAVVDLCHALLSSAEFLYVE
jgi:hypothetical protein